MSMTHIPWRKPQSGKHKRQKLLDKRALKRGDLTAEDHAAGLHQLNDKYGRVKVLPSKSGGVDPNSSSIRLKSRFYGLSSDYLDKTRDLSFEYILERPLSPESAIFPLEILTERDVEGRLTCPSRPKFKVGQSKKEVERNEEGHFKKWLAHTNEVMRDYVDSAEDDEYWPRGPTWFETNLEVWRQLWRVTETSNILLLLLDSRCPLLHCPPSLRSYLQNLKSHKEVILILTKSDLVDPAALEGWRDWVRSWWGQEGVQVVSVRAYDVELLKEGGKARHRSDIPQDSLEELIIALQTAHDRLLQPPEWAISNPEKLKEWKPIVRPSVDWSSLIQEEYPFDVATSHLRKLTKEPDIPLANDETTNTPRDPAQEPLTIGLIGQPNVGKSSLLNALLGEQRVKASRTPGKTKHFQTIFWGSKKEVRFVDCPGLVCPSLVGLEIQALAATIPISQIASLPACITFCAKHLPLETIFRIPYTIGDGDIDPYAGKRTYRDPKLAEAERLKREEEDKKERWTAGKIMEGRAHDRGYLSAKSGRPDINRAANGIMRLLADGKIKWGFDPPGMKGKEGKGIWLENDTSSIPVYDDEKVEEPKDREISTGSEGESESVSEGEEEETEEDEEEESESEHGKPAKNDKIVSQVGGFFDALGIDDDEEDEEDAEEDEEETSDGEDEKKKSGEK
ncbi:uncharacterized protein I303_107716 [Kwoniella dejecticola CBS 10117]|uniref:Guanine nucleotide-binding protein-like 1 n=1 Tax=Kwoniella dejecticola CBS 10117 TaxID=1296121 RepID=A0A1A5ZVH5_9TREE|nr:uncharacterized protein I303_07721 [Kwoniella dejecticola CBS 10117]OBR81811.1 hypothetical protein I303_07721 [Kwoniella dejecticola CBS 10117]